ncbi:MAG: hypothetical protein LBM19_02610 [Holosporales bacterium]|nr:hypothetical protein [Holosporales bacterium]
MLGAEEQSNVKDKKFTSLKSREDSNNFLVADKKLLKKKESYKDYISECHIKLGYDKKFNSIVIPYSKEESYYIARTISEKI